MQIVVRFLSPCIEDGLWIDSSTGGVRKNDCAFVHGPSQTKLERMISCNANRLKNVIANHPA